MLRLSCVFFILISELFAQTVVVAKESLKFGEVIETSKLLEKDVSNIRKSCIPVTFEDLANKKYVTTHFINKNSIICVKDIKENKEQSIIFNFGGFQIEKKGSIVYENDEFIRFKNEDGTMEKIYKDGRLK